MTQNTPLTHVPRRTIGTCLKAADLQLPDEIGTLTGLPCYPENDLARQEFGPETEVKSVLRRHGGSLQVPPPQAYGGGVDYDFDLVDALTLMRDSREAYSRIPADVRRVYPTFQAFLRGLEDGSIVWKPPEGAVGTPQPPQPVTEAPSASPPATP